MSGRVYVAFEALAAVTGGWLIIETGLRLALAEPAGMGHAGVLALAAAGMFIVAGRRRRQLAAESAVRRS